MKSLIEFLAALFRKPANPPFVPASPQISEPVKTSGARKAIGGVAAASVIAAIVAFVQPWEGRRYVAYQDIVGVWTICDGRTKDVHPGDTATPEQCDAWTAEEVTLFNRSIRQCITRQMTQGQEIAFTSLAYNVGSEAVCGSTAIRRFNAGDDTGGCDAIKMWNQAGGKVVRGLVNRRAAESALCKAS